MAGKNKSLQVDSVQKTTTWAELAMKMKEKAAKYKGKKEKTDHDLIAYGVSRDGTEAKGKKKIE